MSDILILVKPCSGWSWLSPGNAAKRRAVLEAGGWAAGASGFTSPLAVLEAMGKGARSG